MQSKGVNIDEVKVASIMSKDFVTVNMDSKMIDIQKMLIQNNLGTLPIVENDQLTGVVSAYDLLKLFEVKGTFFYDHYKDKALSQLEFIARRGVITIGPEDSLRKCIEYMGSFRVLYLPVIDKKRKVVGMISILDIVKFLLSE